MTQLTIRRFLYTILGILALTILCRYSSKPIFEKELMLEIESQTIVPVFVRTLDGEPFSGEAYGTFFGERNSCVEWEGPFKKGLPHGKFSIFKNCNAGESIINYHNGQLVQPGL